MTYFIPTKYLKINSDHNSTSKRPNFVNNFCCCSIEKCIKTTIFDLYTLLLRIYFKLPYETTLKPLNIQKIMLEQ